jgi:hypothetical protein
MKDLGRFLWLGAGLLLGVVGAAVYFGPAKTAQAGDDRYGDFIMCTGPVSVLPGAKTDGVWLLDYRAGKLLGTVIDRSTGKIVGWAEVDLVTEFGIQPKQNVHFMMTTGSITTGQAALYLSETTTGRLGVYTMGQRPDANPGVVIRRHDLVLFRQPTPAGAEAP